MGNVEFLSTHRVKRNDDIVEDIVFILKCMGGAAHLSAIHHAVEARLRQDHREIPRTIKSDVLATLEAFDSDNPVGLKPALFRRPFGAGSLRWQVISG